MSQSDEQSKLRPLDDGDVNRVMRTINIIDKEITNAIFTKYDNTLNSLMALVLTQCTDDDEIVEIERVRRLMTICPIEEKFIRTKDKIWATRYHIINKDISYFMNKDYSKLIKRDSRQTFMEAILEIAKNRYISLTKKEQNLYWAKGVALLNCVARFNKAMREARAKKATN